MLEAENARLLKEIEDLEKSTPDPAVLDDHFKIMEEDKSKFEEYNTLALQRSEKYESRVEVLQEELAKLDEELKEAEEERKGLQKSVDAQGISMQDIDRMTSERERLQKGIETASQRLEELKVRVADKESEASAKLDELERMVDQYNTLAYQIALIPSTAANAKGGDYELHVLVNEGTGDFTSTNLMGSVSGSGTERLLMDSTTGYSPTKILNLDLKGKVRSTLTTLKYEIQDRREKAIEAIQVDAGMLDDIDEAIENTRSEVEALNHKVRSAEDEYEKMREVTTAQKMGSDAQIEKMEKDLSRMRTGLMESVQLLEQREINTTIE
jgi:kinetochore protein NDC80